MADNTVDKEATRAAKEAEKAAKKAKQERIKQSKPKKEGTVFSRAGNNLKKFWKDFTGTIKKVVWPTGKQVLKSSVVVLVTILVVGLVIFGIDRGLTALFNAGTNLATSAGQQLSGETTTAAEGETEAEGASEDATAAEEETEAGETEEAETGAETSEEETTEAQAEETTQAEEG